MKHVLLIVLLSIPEVLTGCGYRWDAMSSAPDIPGTNGLASVEAFITTNGWNMQPKGRIFEVDVHLSKTIGGLPWKNWRKREFEAVTQNGILYVLSNPGWHHDYAGVAYNPQTNKFGSTIDCFRPIGGHWYVWFEGEFQPSIVTQQYE